MRIKQYLTLHRSFTDTLHISNRSDIVENLAKNQDDGRKQKNIKAFGEGFGQLLFSQKSLNTVYSFNKNRDKIIPGRTYFNPVAGNQRLGNK